MESSGAELYLDLLKNCITRLAFPNQYRPLLTFTMPVDPVRGTLQTALAKLNLGLYRRSSLNRQRRSEGRDWPAEAETMVGIERLNMLQCGIRRIIAEKIPGDLI